MIPFGDYLHQDFKALTVDAFLEMVSDGGIDNEPSWGLVTELLKGQDDRRLAELLLGILQSNSFRESVNVQVPPPRPGEPQEAFVERADAEVRSILRSRLARGDV